ALTRAAAALLLLRGCCKQCPQEAKPSGHTSSGTAFGWFFFSHSFHGKVFSSGRLLLSIPLVQLRAAHKPKNRAVLASVPSGSAPLGGLTAPPCAPPSPFIKRIFFIGL